jgi:ribosomal protein S18 acetylase RimI-like enzyme
VTGLHLASLTAADLPDVGALFERRTGRPADLDLLGAWIADAPSAGARLDAELVGYAICKRFAPDLVELASMLVAAGARRRGIGTALLRSLHEAVASAGVAGVVVVTSDGYEVQEERTDAVAFYRSVGYEVLLATAATHVLGRSVGEHLP